MDNQVDVTPASPYGLDRVLQCVVQREPPIDGGQRDDAGPLQNAKGVHVDGKDLAIQTIEKNAPGALPRKAGKLGENALRVGIRDFTERIERQLSELTIHSLEEALDSPRLLAVEAARPEGSRDVIERGTVHVCPASERTPQVLPVLFNSRKIGLKAEDDVDRLIQRVDMIPEHCFGRPVSCMEKLLQFMELPSPPRRKPESEAHSALPASVPAAI
jgi:hypothetical protein